MPCRTGPRLTQLLLAAVAAAAPAVAALRLMLAGDAARLTAVLAMSFGDGRF